MKYTIYQVDAFTDELFKGNPAGVLISEKELPTTLMQNIAAEMNLSETAFVTLSKNTYAIRFFTPTTEITLCGHATLASAHILYNNGIVPKTDDIVFKTTETQLSITHSKEGIKMLFPSFKIAPKERIANFATIIGFEPTELFIDENNWVIAIAKNESEIRKASPNFSKMSEIGLGHLIVTSLSTQNNIDYVLRCFAPQSGIDEDPVTGSVQCGLATLWHSKTQQTTFNVKQLSKRTGKMKVTLKEGTVEIIGKAVSVFEAEMVI